MDSTYRPQSPDLSSYAPQSPDLSGLRPHTPDLSGSLPGPVYSHFGHHPAHPRQPLAHSDHSRGGAPPPPGAAGFGFGGSPTSVPVQPAYIHPQAQYNLLPPQHQQQYYQPPDGDFFSDLSGQPPPTYLPPGHQLQPQPHHHYPGNTNNNHHHQHPSASFTAEPQPMAQPRPDPTLGVHLRTSFPVARIKRIMQADDEIGKVAQVTPHVVSRALELFMIKLISSSATHARGGGSGTGPGAPAGKGQKRILAQHMKKAITTDETFDFLVDIASRVPDAPAKGGNSKKDVSAGSDSEDGGAKPTARRKGRKKKEGEEEF